MHNNALSNDMSSIEAPPLERKLVALLAADVEGYSRHMHEDEESTLVTLSSHRKIVDDLVLEMRGKISGTAGDSVLAEFSSVVDAVRSGIAIQIALREANHALPEKRRMLFRMGINVGDVMVKDGSVFGDGVNVAARLESIAEPGGICVTRGVRDHLRDRADFHFEDLGEHSVKNIARPVRVFRILFDDNEAVISEPRSNTYEMTTSQHSTDSAELQFWQTVEASGFSADYEAYLTQYPDGAFAILARSRLVQGQTSDDKPRQDPVELAFWASVSASDNADMYKAYLEKFPGGEFVELATIYLGQH